MIDFEVKLQEYLRDKFAGFEYKDLTAEQMDEMLNEASD